VDNGLRRHSRDNGRPRRHQRVFRSWRRHRGGAPATDCRCHKKNRRPRVQEHATQRERPFRRCAEHQRRRRRSGGSGLGRDAYAHVHTLRRTLGLQSGHQQLSGRRGSRHQKRNPADRGRVRLRLPEKRKRRAPSGACKSFQRPRQTYDQLRLS